jgi:hypothetical protein
MIRQWIKVVLLAMLVLIQTACPTYGKQQQSDMRANPPADHGGSG